LANTDAIAGKAAIVLFIAPNVRVGEYPRLARLSCEILGTVSYGANPHCLAYARVARLGCEICEQPSETVKSVRFRASSPVVVRRIPLLCLILIETKKVKNVLAKRESAP